MKGVKGPQQLRHEQRRAEKLEEIRDQVARGSLVIRQMTPEEREQNPAPAPDRSRRASKRRA